MPNIDPSTWYTGGGLLGVLSGLVLALWRGWLYTKPQMLREQRLNDATIAGLTSAHEVTNRMVKDQYEGRIAQLQQLYEGRVSDAQSNGRDWKDVGQQALDVNRAMSGQLDIIKEGQTTIMAFMESLRRESEGKQAR